MQSEQDSQTAGQGEPRNQYFDVDHPRPAPSSLPTNTAHSASGGAATQTTTRRAPRVAAEPKPYRSTLTADGSSEPRPLPKRPKGRLFVGIVMFAFAAMAALAVWNSSFRYRAHGTIIGRQISVAVPWDGVIEHYHVREGDKVRQGQLLVTINDLELRQKMERLGDQLRHAQSTLQAEMAQLEWEAKIRDEQAKKAHAEYYEATGELLQQQSLLEDLRIRLSRYEDANKRFARTVSGATVRALSAEIEGKQANIEQLMLAAGELKSRAESANVKDEDIAIRYKPQLAQIETYRAEISRIREQIEQGKIRAPVNGRVLKIHQFVGEQARSSDKVIEIVEDGSVEVVLYVKQSQTEMLKLGESVNVWIDSESESYEFRVTQFGEQMEPPPAQIKRYYAEDAKLLPIYLKPANELLTDSTLKPGSETMLMH